MILNCQFYSAVQTKKISFVKISTLRCLSSVSLSFPLSIQCLPQREQLFQRWNGEHFKLVHQEQEHIASSSTLCFQLWIASLEKSEQNCNGPRLKATAVWFPVESFHIAQCLIWKFDRWGIGEGAANSFRSSTTRCELRFELIFNQGNKFLCILSLSGEQ